MLRAPVPFNHTFCQTNALLARCQAHSEAWWLTPGSYVGLVCGKVSMLPGNGHNSGAIQPPLTVHQSVCVCVCACFYFQDLWRYIKQLKWRTALQLPVEPVGMSHNVNNELVSQELIKTQKGLWKPFTPTGHRVNTLMRQKPMRDVQCQIILSMNRMNETITTHPILCREFIYAAVTTGFTRPPDFYSIQWHQEFT